MTKIFTVCATRADLLAWQLYSFDKHLKDDFEFVVFNNAQPVENRRIAHMRERIDRECRELGLRCIQVKRDDELLSRLQPMEPMAIFGRDGEYSDPGTGNEYSLCWAWEHYISKERNCTVIVLHHDAFLIAPLEPQMLMATYDLAYLPQIRPGIREYMWEMFVMLDMRTLPEPEKICWLGGKVGEHAGDTSVQTSRYLEAHPELDVYHFTSNVYQNVGFGESRRPIYEVLSVEGVPMVLHYTAASNWDKSSEEFHRNKRSWLEGVLVNGLPGYQVPGEK